MSKLNKIKFCSWVLYALFGAALAYFGIFVTENPLAFTVLFTLFMVESLRSYVEGVYKGMGA